MATFGLISNYAFLYTAILLFGGLSAYISERAGIINLGIDGTMCFGAVMFSIMSSPAIGLCNIGLIGLFLAILISGTFSMIIGALQGIAIIKLKSDQSICGIAINFIGLAFASFVNSPLAKLLFDASKLKTNFNDFFYIGNSIYGSSVIIFLLSILVAVILWIIINKTKIGLRWSAIGENPYSVDSQGINVVKYQWIIVLLSSMFAGIAGSLFLFNVKQFHGNVQGLGFLSLGILIIGVWKVEWITICSIIFSLFTSVSQSTLLTNMGFLREISYSVPYILTVFILLFSSRHNNQPEHDGITFHKN